MTDAFQAPQAVGGAAPSTSMFTRLSRASASPDWLAPFAPARDKRSAVASVAAPPAPVDATVGLAPVDYAAPIGSSSSTTAGATSRKGFLGLFSRNAAAAPQPPMALDSLVAMDDMDDVNGHPSVNVTISPFTRPQPAAPRRAENKALAMDSTWGALSGLNNTPVAAPAFTLFSQPKAPRTIDAPAPAAVEPPKALWNELPAPTLDAFSRHRAPLSTEEAHQYAYARRLQPPQAVTVSPLRAETPSPVMSPAEPVPLVPVHTLQPIGEDSPMTEPLPAAQPALKAATVPAATAAVSATSANPITQLLSQDWWSSLLTSQNGAAVVASEAPNIVEFSRSVAPPATVEDRKQRERDAKKEDYLQTVFAQEEPLLALASAAGRGASKPTNATRAILAEFDEEDRRADDIYQAVSIVLEAVRHADTPSSPSPLF